MWNQGYATQAIYLVSKHLFHTLQMRCIGADSCNPAFIASVTQKLGWTLEGTLRNRMLNGDYYLVGQLASEFKSRPEYEQ